MDLFKLDPLNHFVDLLGNAVGLSPTATSAVKLVAGAATGNVMMAIDGGRGLAAELSKNPPATTELLPSLDPAIAGKGYAGTAQRPGPSAAERELVDYKRHLETVRDHFQTFDNGKGWLIRNDGLFSADDLQALTCGNNVPPRVREAAQFLLGKLAELDRAAGIGGRDGLIGLQDIMAQMAIIEGKLARLRTPVNDGGRPAAPPPPARSSAPAPKPVASESTPTSSVTSSPPPSGESQLDPNIVPYREALEILWQNWETFDTAASRRDEYITRDDLRSILRNPKASAKLKQAARFLLDHPEYFDRLEMAGGVGRKDAVIGKGDVAAERARVDGEIARFGRPETSESSSSTGAGSLKDIINDPTLSLEEKIQLLMEGMLDGLDQEIENVMNELDDASMALARRRDAAQGGSKVSAEEETGAQRGIEKLQARLQRLMERRKQMFELMSNMSMKFNEMAKTALQNMARS